MQSPVYHFVSEWLVVCCGSYVYHSIINKITAPPHLGTTDLRGWNRAKGRDWWLCRWSWGGFPDTHLWLATWWPWLHAQWRRHITDKEGQEGEEEDSRGIKRKKEEDRWVWTKLCHCIQDYNFMQYFIIRYETWSSVEWLR